MAELKASELERLKKDLAFLDAHALRIGWISNPLASRVNTGKADDKMQDDKGITTPTTVAQVARAHELGRGVPERSMLKATMTRKRKEIGNLQVRAVKAVVAGKVTPEQGMSLVGEGVLTAIKQRMVRGIPPPLSDRRRKEKERAGRKKDTPLINWGQLLNSPRYKIVKAQ